MLNTINFSKVERQIFGDQYDTERQIARYDQECGEVVTYKMSDRVMEQEPVAYLNDLKA